MTASLLAPKPFHACLLAIQLEMISSIFSSRFDVIVVVVSLLLGWEDGIGPE